MSLAHRKQPANAFLPTREAAELVGYTTDYVARLAREQKVTAKRYGSQWLIDVESLKLFSLEVAAEKRNRKKALRQERMLERIRKEQERQQMMVRKTIVHTGWNALAQTAIVSFCFFLVFNLVWFALESDIDTKRLAAGAASIKDRLAARIVEPNQNLFSQSASLAFVGQARDIDTSDDFHIANEVTVASATPESSTRVRSIQTMSSSAATSSVEHSFSDEVLVELSGDGNGTVTPIFRDGVGNSYQFNLLPLSTQHSPE